MIIFIVRCYTHDNKLFPSMTKQFETLSECLFYFNSVLKANSVLTAYSDMSVRISTIQN